MDGIRSIEKGKSMAVMQFQDNFSLPGGEVNLRRDSEIIADTFANGRA